LLEDIADSQKSFQGGPKASLFSCFENLSGPSSWREIIYMSKKLSFCKPESSISARCRVKFIVLSGSPLLEYMGTFTGMFATSLVEAFRRRSHLLRLSAADSDVKCRELLPSDSSADHVEHVRETLWQYNIYWPERFEQSTCITL
jgi:hypothetical protein